jgi:hypothetical protein
MSRNMRQRIKKLEKHAEYLSRDRLIKPNRLNDPKHRARVIANTIYRARLEGDPEKIAMIEKSLKKAQRLLDASKPKASR